MHNLPLLPLLIFGTLVVSISTFAVVISLITLKQRQVRNRLARQKMEFDYSQSLLETRLEVQETTLNMLARELHDHFTQALTGCYMQFNIGAGIADREGRESVMTEAKENLLGVISDIRLLSHSLATGMIETRSLEDAIRAELSRIQTFTSIPCSLRSESLHELAPEQRLIVFRIVQEVLQNALKHAGAKHISIYISETSEHYCLSITDDGKGFDADAALAGGSLGLMSMRERVAMLKGESKIHSQPGQGTTIELTVPLNPADEKGRVNNLVQRCT